MSETFCSQRILAGIVLGCIALAVLTSGFAQQPPATIDSSVPRFAFHDEATSKYGYVDTKGRIVIEAKYRHALDFSDGLGRVSIGKSMSFIDESGEVVFSLPEAADTTVLGADGCIWYAVKDKWGFVARTGKVVVEPTYDDVFAFSEGLARVNRGAEFIFPGVMDGGRWGYVDTTGEMVIPIQHEYADDFHEGVARVSGPGPTRFIDRTGDTVLELRTLSEFSEGLCPVHVDRSLKGKYYVTRYVDRKGEIQFEIEGYGKEFREGLATVTIAEGLENPNDRSSYRLRTGFINHEGEWVIPPKFLSARSFSDGLAAVCRRRKTDGTNETWGYIDRTGKMVIWPRFNEPSEFADGAAKVHIGGTYALVEDHPGWWEGGEWILIDRTGKKLASLQKTNGM